MSEEKVVSSFEEEFRPRRGTPKLTLGLVAALVLVAGVLIGIQAQKALGGATAAGEFGTRMGYGGAQPSGGPSAGPGPQGQRPGGAIRGPGQGDATVGTVEKVEKDRIRVKTMDGSTVVVTTTGETTVQVTERGALSDLKSGSTVVVQGEKGGNGEMAATSISQGGGFGARG
ncbi:hypothetical protein ACFXJ8_08105 [Nonomuraea sp. NPDC059194]|uniref:hypothetical protein n=1 Tax=Nonomuraea sp. NPDC059194 TaxID=3346764 RepID=UPI0036B7D23F